MRILVVNTLYHPYFQGGAEKSVQLLCEGFRDAGHEVEVVCMGPSTHRGVVNGIPVHYLRTRNVKGFMKVRGSFAPLRLLWHLIDVYNPFYFWFFRRLLKRYRPDVLFSNNLSGFSVVVWSLSQRFKVPVVHTLRDYYLLCPKGTMFKRGRRCEKQCVSCKIFSLAKKVASARVDAVVGISDFVLQKHLNAGFFRDGSLSVVVNNGVDSSVSTWASEKDNVIIDSKEMVTFGFLGRISIEKGVGYLINEFKQLPDDCNASLLLAGSGDPSYIKVLEKQCQGDRIEFVGRVNPPDFFEKIDVLVVPSLWDEAFGRVVIEAWNAGVFVLGADRGGISELAVYGNMALFNPESGQLKTLLLAFLQGEFRFDREKFLTINEQFGKERGAQAYLDIFKQVLT